MTDNVVPFGKPTEPVDDLGPAHDPTVPHPRQRMYDAIREAVDFLFAHRDDLNYFVLVTSDNREGSDKEVAAFHNIFSSPITKADFCLAAKLLDRTLMEGL